MEIPVSPAKDNKIFISIASYRDPLLKFTINEAYENAKHKDNIIFGVVEQNELEDSLDLNEFKFKDQIRYIRVDPGQSRGCCWARNLVQSLYLDEKYFFQIDSHTAFDYNWDETFIFALEDLRRYHDKPIITQYPWALEFDENGKPIKKFVKERNKIPFIAPPPLDEPTWTMGESLHIIARGFSYDSNQPFTHGFMLAAGCLFTLGDFVEEVPYDPRIFFQGEETTLALRAWTRGWNIFHMTSVPVLHLYTDHEKRTRRLFWDETEAEARTFSYTEIDAESTKRIDEVLSGKTYTAFGLGSKRTMDQFKTFTGIDYLNKIYTERKNLHRHDYKRTPEDYIRKQ